MNKNLNNPATGWGLAARLCGEYSEYSGKAEVLLDRSVTDISTRERQHCQCLFLGAVRHWRLIEATIRKCVPRPPKRRLWGMLAAALGELRESHAGKHPKIVDFWVSQTRQSLSKSEAGLINAVLRKAIDDWNALKADVSSLALYHSHPDWLVEKWIARHGLEKTRKLLEWNQLPANVYLRIRKANLFMPAGCERTPWPDFWRWTGRGEWTEIKQLLDNGSLYAQDPSTVTAPGLLDVQPGQRVLDMCAAPGGKSLILAEALGDDPSGELVCVDVPGPRVKQLDANLHKLSSESGPNIQLIIGDALEITASTAGQFDAILLDAPCSNTGVLRRRPDAKRRLTPQSISRVLDLQRRLLERALSLLSPHGRLVYSTCSLESEENEGQVAHLTASYPQLNVVKSHVSYPWASGHDGAGAFLLG